MADWPVKSLGDKTLLQYAKTPYMDKLARMGRNGRLITVAEGFPSFFNAAATIAEMLNVFLLLALPVDALKLPSVPMVEPFTQSISGGTS